MIRRCVAALVFSVLPVSLAADELHVYESIDNISIGRVFLTPEQRSWLDVHRHDVRADRVAAPAEDLPTQDTAGKSTNPATSAAGYIIKSDGGQQRWSNGDFVVSRLSSLAAMKFPGDIKIVRHASGKREDITREEDTTDPVKVRETPK